MGVRLLPAPVEANVIAQPAPANGWLGPLGVLGMAFPFEQTSFFVLPSCQQIRSCLRRVGHTQSLSPLTDIFGTPETLTLQNNRLRNELEPEQPYEP